MRNILIVIAFIIASCDIQPKAVKAQNSTAPYTEYANGGVYDYQEKEIQDMTYGIWYVRSNSSQTGYSIFAVNITKDMLEVQLLRQQIANNINKK